MPSKIRIAAAIIQNNHGQTLVVRKHRTDVFIQPGGKIKPGETPLDTLSRELNEELNCPPVRTRFCGHFSAPAANEPQHVVEAAIYWVDIDGPVIPASEIAEIAWIDPSNPAPLNLAPLNLAPLTRDFILPLARSRSR